LVLRRVQGRAASPVEPDLARFPGPDLAN